jgi:hypothetical protein
VRRNALHRFVDIDETAYDQAFGVMYDGDIDNQGTPDTTSPLYDASGADSNDRVHVTCLRDEGDAAQEWEAVVASIQILDQSMCP